MLIRYADGPFKGDTIETTASEIVGTFIEDGAVWEVRYRVDRPNYLAWEIARKPVGALPLPLPEPEPMTIGTLLGALCDASTEQLLAELARRAEAGDPVAAGYLRPVMNTPMRSRQGPRPRAGFGNVTT